MTILIVTVNKGQVTRKRRQNEKEGINIDE